MLALVRPAGATRHGPRSWLRLAAIAPASPTRGRRHVDLSRACTCRGRVARAAIAEASRRAPTDARARHWSAGRPRLAAARRARDWRRRHGLVDDLPAPSAAAGAYPLAGAGVGRPRRMDASVNCPYETALALEGDDEDAAARALEGSSGSGRPRRAAGGPPPARARRAGHPARPAAATRANAATDDARESRSSARRRRLAQRRDRRATVPLPPHGRPPRLGDPAQARRRPRVRGRRRRRHVSGCSKTGNAAAKT